MTDRQQLVDTANTVFTNKTTQIGAYTSTGAGIISALSKIDLVAQIFLCIGLITLSITILSFLMNWRYKYKQDKREQEIHIVKMQLMKEGKWHGQE
ncbi:MULTISPECIES: phage holin family protein [Acinetobacter]|uniref:hypothetical protein n=1 Tax=Acinetobacter TaxID=469 RepID=UPI0018A27082|nr:MULTISPECIES: hypothetical protein [Acinetobacter]MBF7690660.1 hypothetical protein [Acinetobacter pollinis]MBF7698616.1 hypothetical protein [Acinetobacter pollinis]WEV48073.1 hypothetical protein OZX61_07190 [Acinetobacter sp. ESL0695]